MLNKVILIGRLTRNPDLRHTRNNIAVAEFSLAVERDRKTQDGEKETDFLTVIAWGKLAEFVSKWFTKGMLAIVVGRLESRSWTDQNGNKRVSIEVNASEVQFGETKKARDAAQSSGTDRAYMDALANASDTDFTPMDDQSDVPF